MVHDAIRAAVPVGSVAPADAGRPPSPCNAGRMRRCASAAGVAAAITVAASSTGCSDDRLDAHQMQNEAFNGPRFGTVARNAVGQQVTYRSFRKLGDPEHLEVVPAEVVHRQDQYVAQALAARDDLRAALLDGSARLSIRVEPLRPGLPPVSTLLVCVGGTAFEVPAEGAPAITAELDATQMADCATTMPENRAASARLKPFA